MKRNRARPPQSGQMIVLFALGLIALIAGVAFVVDGGNSLAQQRTTQNSADAAAEAGTVVIAQYLMGGSSSTGAAGTCPTTTADPWDLEVCKAVYGSASRNNVSVQSAQYADFKGIPLGAVGGGSLPAGAQGVQMHTSRQFGTYFARALGFSTFTATTQATAVTGTITALCTPGSPCGVFPLTIPVQIDNCDNTGKLAPGSGSWPFLGNANTTPANEAIVPICANKNGEIGGGSAGSVGWLDLSTALGATTTGNCGNTFITAIQNPCITSLPYPTWIKTFSGGVGKGGPQIEDALNAYHGDVIQIPVFDGTCKVLPGGTAKDDCPSGQIGVGANTWYHVPSFDNFKLDYVYLNGNNRQECFKLPGSPFSIGNPSDGCMKGWWVIALPGPGAINLGPVTPSTSNTLGVQLIK